MPITPAPKRRRQEDQESRSSLLHSKLEVNLDSTPSGSNKTIQYKTKHSPKTKSGFGDGLVGRGICQ